jgi:hypothetical protein
MQLKKAIRTSVALFLTAYGTSAWASSNNLVALMPDEGRFRTVLEALRDQAGPGYHIDVIDVNKNPTVKTIADRCTSVGVQGLILMDTKAVNEAIELQKYDTAFKALPKFVFMTLLAELSAKGLMNSAGITFEVPLYTLVTNFRIISQKDFSTIGIFYRKSFSHSIEESKKLLEKEQIALNAVCIDCDQNQKTSVDNVLRTMNDDWGQMVSKEKVEVFIMPADNLIVNSKSLTEFWLGKIKNKKIPVVATIDLLASEKFGAAVFAADPDLIQLGNQAAGQITEHFENNTAMGKIGFEPTISIKSTLNTHVADELGWKLKSEKLGRITTIIK